MITFKTPKQHWNYFIAIERDLEKLSRYVEFADANLNTYSIELAHILLSASSEVDVIMKQLCKTADAASNPKCIDDYKLIVQKKVSTLINEEICIDRYGLSFKPWDSWNGPNNPNWWRSHNKVKHQRNDHFNEANLQNALNAVGALLITVIYYYKLAYSEESGQDLNFRDVTRELKPDAAFMRINSDYYYSHLIV